MDSKIGATYHNILLESHYGIWTINPLKGHLVLKIDMSFSQHSGWWDHIKDGHGILYGDGTVAPTSVFT